MSSVVRILHLLESCSLHLTHIALYEWVWMLVWMSSHASVQTYKKVHWQSAHVTMRMNHGCSQKSALVTVYSLWRPSLRSLRRTRSSDIWQTTSSNQQNVGEPVRITNQSGTESFSAETSETLIDSLSNVSIYRYIMAIIPDWWNDG